MAAAQARELLRAPLRPVESCLAGEYKGLERALLEVHAIIVVPNVRTESRQKHVTRMSVVSTEHKVLMSSDTMVPLVRALVKLFRPVARPWAQEL